MFRHRIWRTTASRLAVRFAALLAVCVLILLGLIYVETAGVLSRRVDRALAAEVEALRRGGPDTLLPRADAETARDPIAAFGLFSSDGARAGGGGWVVPADLAAAGVSRDLPGRAGRAPQRAVRVSLPWGETLVVQRDISQLVELRRIVFGALVWSGALILGLGGVLAFTLSLRPLARVRAMQDAGDRIAAGDLAIRLPIDGGGDELDALARIVNAMMDEVERLVAQAKTVGEGVAHELRTPLTRLRTTLDHASRRFEDDEARRRLLERCVAETDAVLARFRGLLRIAAVEARSRRSGVARASLGAIVEQVAELYAPLADEHGVALEVVVEPCPDMEIDADLMFEAVSNLVDNALKFSGRGGGVRIALRRLDAGVVVEVRDHGPGVAPEERALVIQRFYRSRSAANVPGHGLGLSLVSAVAALHGWTLSIDDAHPGAVVRLRS